MIQFSSLSSLGPWNHGLPRHHHVPSLELLCPLPSSTAPSGPAATHISEVSPGPYSDTGAPQATRLAHTPSTHHKCGQVSAGRDRCAATGDSVGAPLHPLLEPHFASLAALGCPSPPG